MNGVKKEASSHFFIEIVGRPPKGVQQPTFLQQSLAVKRTNELGQGEVAYGGFFRDDNVHGGQRRHSSSGGGAHRCFRGCARGHGAAATSCEAEIAVCVVVAACISGGGGKSENASCRVQRWSFPVSGEHRN